ncbi:Putative Zinc finger, FYVE/PHD-type, Zinc finger, RING/FYVE/PHD-type [Septoria linicola]|uniref:Zinc finger, FYVE/PHD-type, Zinc finger, RING/FYVE/PHD-type n=1 Tax=Septoria linicola TaxID=215465 RepID=A0A9Q9EI97_9PEZI|nr:putative Zinc finger, FYVE/PHD-type, Zinc finger, RING/FYVE/PHD-type [Septoria linicola]USW50864.1 Putative Zinc finger, FYVE/PHD-type, Zinc finger, RING/FYVE/PHD-type [Septoria linicola]
MSGNEEHNEQTAGLVPLPVAPFKSTTPLRGTNRTVAEFPSADRADQEARTNSPGSSKRRSISHVNTLSSRPKHRRRLSYKSTGNAEDFDDEDYQPKPMRSRFPRIVQTPRKMSNRSIPGSPLIKTSPGPLSQKGPPPGSAVSTLLPSALKAEGNDEAESSSEFRALPSTHPLRETPLWERPEADDFVDYVALGYLSDPHDTGMCRHDCRSLDTNDMIHCDGTVCYQGGGWFHLPCVWFRNMPPMPEERKWYCLICRRALRVEDHGNGLVPSDEELLEEARARVAKRRKMVDSLVWDLKEGSEPR